MDTDEVLRKGISFLANEQQKNGGFLSLSSSQTNDFKRAKKYHSTFLASLIFSATTILPKTPELGKLHKNIAQFLLSQKSAYWSFNYWERGSKESTALPYPDDLDDTFCALSALYLYDADTIDGEVLGKIATLLTATEEKEGGPYRTWLVHDDAPREWKDIDLAVNNNIAYFLFLQGVSLPSLKKLTEKAIQNEDYTSQYYPITYPIIYFISRWYKGKGSNDMKDFLLKKQKNGIWENPLYTALAVSSLINLGEHPEELSDAIEYIIKNQKKDGSWGPCAFCMDPAIDRKNYYAGSSALTTAFCLEAISKWKVESEKLKVRNENRVQREPQEEMSKNIIKEVRQRFAALDDDLKKQLETALKRVQKMDKDKHIVLLPHLFFKSMRTDLQQKFAEAYDRKEIISSLCRANIYGWIAYTIYDDFLDEEGDPRALSAATLCLRELTAIFERIAPGNPAIARMFHRTVDTIDAANTWETSNCRDKEMKKVPDYGNLERLADRSLGHSLGPVSILILLGYDRDAPETRALTEFFTHYLIARQLNDDAHDWEDDLKKGHINAVGARILKKTRAVDVASAQKNDDYTALESVFWHTVIDDVCGEITRHANKARKAITRIRSVADPALFTAILAGPEAMVAKTKKEKVETLKFLRSF